MNNKDQFNKALGIALSKGLIKDSVDVDPDKSGGGCKFLSLSSG